jgi:hypothetical protein
MQTHQEISAAAAVEVQAAEDFEIQHWVNLVGGHTEQDITPTQEETGLPPRRQRMCAAIAKISFMYSEVPYILAIKPTKCQKILSKALILCVKQIFLL